MKSFYPKSFSELPEWALTNRVSVSEARIRFAQYGVLLAIASSRTLSALLVLKGGNALDFVWQPNRSTRDLDFSIDMLAQQFAVDADSLKTLLSPVLDTSGRSLGIAYRVHRVVAQPPGPDKSFVTFEARIGYALPDESALRSRIEAGQPSANVIPVEISLNEPICADKLVEIDSAHRVRVCTLEDIVAEKLRALLQQPIRNRMRRQDLLDIAVIYHENAELDLSIIGAFLQQKAKARGISVSREAFRNPEIAERAKQNYDSLKSTTRSIFIPYEESLEALYQIVNSLDIPQNMTSDPTASNTKAP